MLKPPNGLVSLLTDFGVDEPYVGLMKGMIKRENRRAEIIDLCHAVPAQNIRVAGLFLQSAVGRFPPGTVHLAVVDPGVGTDRRLLAVAAHGCYWLAPDNGLLDGLLDDATEVRELQPQRLDLRPASATFHGRDILAPFAGRLSAGRFGYRATGPRLASPQRLPALEGHSVIHIDRFGNLITDLTAAELGAAQRVRVAGREVAIQPTYGAVGEGELLAVVNSFDLLEIAVNCGDARASLPAAVGDPVALA